MLDRVSRHPRLRLLRLGLVQCRFEGPCGNWQGEAGSSRERIGKAACGMRITWLQPWFRRRTTQRTPTPAAAVSRWSFVRRKQCRNSCSDFAGAAPPAAQPAHPIQHLSLSLRHHLDVGLVTQHLMHKLGCDEWHVMCRHDHQMVIRLTQGGLAKYHVVYECSPPVEKAVCHGSRAWALTLTPTHGEDSLPAAKVAELKAGLAGLQG